MQYRTVIKGGLNATLPFEIYSEIKLAIMEDPFNNFKSSASVASSTLILIGFIASLSSFLNEGMRFSTFSTKFSSNSILSNSFVRLMLFSSTFLRGPANLSDILYFQFR
ncbi:hypothetical protein TNCT_65651 [Trichonephila clavata]|uniref:Uncharacterized protein n=1 Tax=Trichonephila clavata TaxID=2740835 RepID=A0A8X6LVK9_TRICU|nr:hypothetical protein TNCT_65651 [Trichonephila clavata]